MDSLLSSMKTGLELFQQKDQHSIKLGCSSIDNLLKGGFECEHIIEITGESAAGKTQLLLQLALQSQLNYKDGGIESSVVYLNSEGNFPSKRLDDLSIVYNKYYSYIQKNTFTDNILVRQIYSPDMLYNTLELLSTYTNESILPTKVIIIDSITALFRGDESFVNNNIVHRNEWITKIYVYLYHLCIDLHFTIFIANQVSSAPLSESDHLLLSAYGTPLIPALSSLVTSFTHERYMLCKHKSTYPSDFPNDIIMQQPDSPLSTDILRDFYVLRSSYLPLSKTYYIITSNGLHDILI